MTGPRSGNRQAMSLEAKPAVRGRISNSSMALLIAGVGMRRSASSSSRVSGSVTVTPLCEPGGGAGP